MIKLMVSYDCGMSYGLDREANSVEELQPRMDELNRELWRWYLEGEDGEQMLDVPCSIHAGILAFMAQANTASTRLGGTVAKNRKGNKPPSG